MSGSHSGKYSGKHSEALSEQPGAKHRTPHSIASQPQRTLPDRIRLKRTSSLPVHLDHQTPYAKQLSDRLQKLDAVRGHPRGFSRAVAAHPGFPQTYIKHVDRQISEATDAVAAHERTGAPFSARFDISAAAAQVAAARADAHRRKSRRAGDSPDLQYRAAERENIQYQLEGFRITTKMLREDEPYRRQLKASVERLKDAHGVLMRLRTIPGCEHMATKAMQTKWILEGLEKKHEQAEGTVKTVREGLLNVKPQCLQKLKNLH